MASAGKFEIGKVLSRAFDTIGANLGLYLALALPLAGAPAFLINWWQTQYMPSGDPQAMLEMFRSGAFWGPIAAVWIVSMVTQSILEAALTRATVKSLSGQVPGLVDSLELGLRLSLPVLAINLVMGIATSFGLILFIVPGVILWLCWSMAVPAYVEEKIGPMEALSRSLDLTRDQRGNIFALMLVVVIGLAIFGGILGAVGSMIGDGAPVLAGIVQGFVGAVSAMVNATVIATAYVELRNAKEGGISSELDKVFS